jgi:hypothetical protein
VAVDLSLLVSVSVVVSNRARLDKCRGVLLVTYDALLHVGNHDHGSRRPQIEK